MRPVSLVIRYLSIAFVCALVLVSNAEAVECDRELRTGGAVEAVDVTLGEITVNGQRFGTDADTEFEGEADALGDFAAGDQAKIRYCLSGPPPIALRVEKLPGVIPPNAQVIDLDVAPGSEAVPVLRAYGDDPGERFGAGVTDGIAFGDINGDGYADMIVGAWSADRPDTNTGVVYVIYGGADAASSVVDLNTDGVNSIDQETRIRIDRPSSLLGAAVTSGDIDGDGIDDVLIGAVSTAQVHIVYGDSNLPGTTVILDSSGANVDSTLILGAAQRQRTGASLASGDVNGDGFADVIIGAPGEDPFVGPRGGAVTIVYGASELRGTTLSLKSDGSINVAGETRILGERAGDETGRSVASGDVNGDGFADVIIGAWRSNALFTTDRGQVYIVYGGIDLPGRTVDLGATRDAIGPDGETRIWGSATNNRLGNTVSSGDVNGDGFADVIAGASGITGPGDNFSVGQVYVFYGSAQLPGRIIDLRDLPGTHGETQIPGREEFGRFGDSVASADINGDGFDDLVMGSPGAVPLGTLPETNSVSDGALYALFGGPTLPGRLLIDIREFADLIVLADNPNDEWGTAAEAGGDLNRDGFPEYAASAFLGDNPFIGGENTSGYAVALFGGAPTTFTATVHRASRAGDGSGGDVVPRAEFGPVVRCDIDFSDDDFATAGMTSATITRSNTALNLSLPNAANVHWSVGTKRSGWASARVTFHYTDAEMAGLDEAQLSIYQADSPVGPFTALPTAVDPERNTVTATVTRLSVFALAVGASGSGG